MFFFLFISLMQVSFAPTNTHTLSQTMHACTIVLLASLNPWIHDFSICFQVLCVCLCVSVCWWVYDSNGLLFFSRRRFRTETFSMSLINTSCLSWLCQLLPPSSLPSLSSSFVILRMRQKVRLHKSFLFVSAVIKSDRWNNSFLRYLFAQKINKMQHMLAASANKTIEKLLTKYLCGFTVINLRTICTQYGIVMCSKPIKMSIIWFAISLHPEPKTMGDAKSWCSYFHYFRVLWKSVKTISIFFRNARHTHIGTQIHTQKWD